MRKFVVVALALVATTAMAAVAFAQGAAAPTITGSFAVTPAKSGTKAKPANTLLTAIFDINRESNTTISQITYTIPPGIKVDGKGFKTCSVDTINQQGESACPAGSKVGTGSAVAYLSGNGSQLNFDVEVYASGAKELALYLQTNLFNIAIPGTINGQTITIPIPERVQRPVGGLYSYVTNVTANLGPQEGISGKTTVKKKVKKTIKKNGKKKTVTRTIKVPKYFVSSVNCPGGQHSGAIAVNLAANPNQPPVPTLSTTASAPCS